MLLTSFIYATTNYNQSKQIFASVQSKMVRVMETDLPEKHKSDQELTAERQTYTIEEAAKILGICRAVAYRKGVLPTIRVAGRRLVPKRALERMLAKTA